MNTKPMEIADAETCLQLTLRALNLNAKDSEFLEKAMRAYGDMRADLAYSLGMAGEPL